MQTKTYFASSVPAAFEVARKELGPDAMLISSQPTSDAMRHLGKLEVSFQWEAEPLALWKPAARPARRGPLAIARDRAPLEQENLTSEDATEVSIPAAGSRRPRRSSRSAACSLPVSTKSAAGSREKATVMVGRLAATGLDNEIAADIAAAASKRAGNRSAAVLAELIARIPVAPFEPVPASGCRALAFAGPAGRGKTTTLVKIAFRFGLAARVPVRIYSAGVHGVGCQEQLARYASILGVPFHAFESLDGLNLALSGDGWKGLVLIDTPGISPNEVLELGELSRFLAQRPEVERHLVLRSDTSSADMLNVVSRFSALAPSRLLFTGFDEANSLGSAVNTLLRTTIPATFAGTGPEVPEGLEEVSAGGLARSIWREDRAAAVAA